MTAREFSAGEGVRGEAASASVTSFNQAISAQRHVYPLLMIGGVYRMSFAKLQEGPRLAVYALPACVTSISRHRARMRVRSSVHALRRSIDETGADVSPRHDEASANTMTARP